MPVTFSVTKPVGDIVNSWLLVLMCGCVVGEGGEKVKRGGGENKSK